MSRKLFAALVIIVLLGFCYNPLQASWLSDRTGINIDLNHEIGTGVASMGAPVVQKFEESGNRLIDRMSQNLDDKLAKLDQIAQQNEVRIQSMVTASIAQVDQDISKEIDHADQVLETRLGNADVIAAKAELGFEDVVRHVVLLGCVLVFFTAVGLRLLGRARITNHAPLDFAITAVCLACLYAAYVFVPHGNVNKIIASHEQGYRDGLAVLDFREAKYHLAQLKILRPGEREILGREKKLALLENVLSRPALYQTRSGVFDFKTKLAQARYLLPTDPDLDVITAFVAWQTGTERIDEYAAASVCTNALLRNPIKPGKEDDFFLRSLASQYIRNYLLNPLPDSVIKARLPEKVDLVQQSTEEMERAVRENSVDMSPLNALSELLQFDSAANTLYRNMIPAYVTMIYSDATLSAIGAGDQPAKANLITQRRNSAQKIEAAWKAFDAQLVTLDDPACVLWTLRINSVFLKRVAEFDEYQPAQRYGADEHQKFVTSLLDRLLPSTDLLTNTPNRARQLVDLEVLQRKQAAEATETSFETQLKAFVYRFLRQGLTTRRSRQLDP